MAIMSKTMVKHMVNIYDLLKHKMDWDIIWYNTLFSDPWNATFSTCEGDEQCRSARILPVIHIKSTEKSYFFRQVTILAHHQIPN